MIIVQFVSFHLFKSSISACVDVSSAAVYRSYRNTAVQLIIILPFLEKKNRNTSKTVYLKNGPEYRYAGQNPYIVYTKVKDVKYSHTVENPNKCQMKRKRI